MLEYALKQERWVPYHPLLLQPTHSTHIPQQVSNKCSVFRFYNKNKLKKKVPATETVLRVTVAVSDSHWSTKHHVGFVDKDSNRCVSAICRVTCSATELNWCLKSSGLSLPPPPPPKNFLLFSLSQSDVSAGVSRSRVLERFPRVQLVLCLQLRASVGMNALYAVRCSWLHGPQQEDRIGRSKSPLSTKGEVTVGTFFPRRKGDAVVVVVTTLCISLSLWSMAAHWNRDVSDVYTSLLKCL